MLIVFDFAILDQTQHFVINIQKRFGQNNLLLITI